MRDPTGFDQHCLVTGANRGLGLEFTRQLLARGARVVATCRHPGRATALNSLAGQHPARLHVLPLDVAASRSREELLHELPLVLGPARIDLLVNNAGLLHGGERFGQVAESDLEASVLTNAIGPFMLTQTLAPLLADAGDASPGAVVANLSSQLGSIARCTGFRTPSYAIGKAALNMATALLDKALAMRGIRVVALHPGWVRTDMGGAQAPLAVEDSVAALLRTIDGLGPRDGGRFLDGDGHDLPW